MDLENIQSVIAAQSLEIARSALLAIAILVIGFWIAGRLARTVRAAIDRSERLDATIAGLAETSTRLLVRLAAVLAVLSIFGVEMSSVVAVIGAAGLAIGLALQGTLTNVASGVMLLVLRPFSVGDGIEVAGHSGTAKSIGLFTTEIATWNNVYVSIPNSSIWNSAITNYSMNPTRRVDLTIGIDYGDDIDKAIEIALGILKDEGRILEEPEPMVAVKNLGDSSVDLAVRGHTVLDDFWPTTFDLLKRIKQTYDDNGISIPFPQRTITLLREQEDTPSGPTQTADSQVA